MVRMLPLKDTDRMPHPLYREGEDIFFTTFKRNICINIRSKIGKLTTVTCRVRASRRSVLPLEPTAYMFASLSTDRQTFSMLCGSFFDIT